MTDATYPIETGAFSSFGLSGPMLEALERKGFTAPTPIQAIALPRLLADEGHLIVKARTGTGKTAAFGIPLLERLVTGGHAPRALILTPTRELALQVSREIASLAPRRQDAGSSPFSGAFPRITAVYGGASIRNQILDLKRGTEIVVGTPGRVIDLMERKVLDLAAVDWFILDEADEMLDMGFFEDVEKILNHIRSGGRILSDAPLPQAPEAFAETPPSLRKTLHIALFSATMPEAILKVIREYLGAVEIVEDAGPDDDKPLVDQFYMVLRKEDRLEALRRIIDQAEDFYGLVFCATKVETDELARRLVEAGYPAEAIHGDLSQEARERTLRRFRSRHTTILVATDVAARGLDIERLTHVINWDLPNDRETYVHRIGRTGRAGRRGRALSLALPGERRRMDQLSRSMEKTLGSGILWTKVPSIKSVMKAIKSRIRQSVLTAAAEASGADPDALPQTDGVDPGPAAGEEGFADVPAGDALDGNSANGNFVAGINTPAAGAPVEAQPASRPADVSGETGNSAAGINTSAASINTPAAENVSPVIAQLSRELTERLGADEAVTVLLSMAYGDALDSSRYGTITEIPELPLREERIKAAGKGGFKRGGQIRRGSGGASARTMQGPGGGSRRAEYGNNYDRFREEPNGRNARVYVGLGRRHGANARDVALLLSQAGGVPGRLVDAIEMKDFCAFATMPSDAAKRACVFSRNAPDDPAIRLASPKE